MYPYFTKEEVARFREISRLQSLTLNQTLCSTKLDALWQPFLDRLHKMDPSISNKIPYPGKMRPWRYPQFEAGFERLSKKYAQEIENIQKEYPELAQRYLQSLEFSGLSLLQQLEKQHEALEKVKEEIAKAQHCTNQIPMLNKDFEHGLCGGFQKLTI